MVAKTQQATEEEDKKEMIGSQRVQQGNTTQARGGTLIPLSSSLLQVYYKQQITTLNILQHHAEPHNTTQHNTTPRSTTQHHAAPCTTTQNHAEPRRTMQHHAAPRSTTHHHAEQRVIYIYSSNTCRSFGADRSTRSHSLLGM